MSESLILWLSERISLLEKERVPKGDSWQNLCRRLCLWGSERMRKDDKSAMCGIVHFGWTKSELFVEVALGYRCWTDTKLLLEFCSVRIWGKDSWEWEPRRRNDPVCRERFSHTSLQVHPSTSQLLVQRRRGSRTYCFQWIVRYLYSSYSGKTCRALLSRCGEVDRKANPWVSSVGEVSWTYCRKPSSPIFRQPNTCDK